MSEFELHTHEEQPKENYLNWRQTVSSWLLTQDHKRIALMPLSRGALHFRARD